MKTAMNDNSNTSLPILQDRDGEVLHRKDHKKGSDMSSNPTNGYDDERKSQ